MTGKAIAKPREDHAAVIAQVFAGTVLEMAWQASLGRLLRVCKRELSRVFRRACMASHAILAAIVAATGLGGVVGVEIRGCSDVRISAQADRCGACMAVLTRLWFWRMGEESVFKVWETVTARAVLTGVMICRGTFVFMATHAACGFWVVNDLKGITPQIRKAWIIVTAHAVLASEVIGVRTLAFMAADATSWLWIMDRQERVTACGDTIATL